MLVEPAPQHLETGGRPAVEERRAVLGLEEVDPYDTLGVLVAEIQRARANHAAHPRAATTASAPTSHGQSGASPPLPPIVGCSAGRPASTSRSRSWTVLTYQPPRVRWLSKNRCPGAVYVTGLGSAYG